MARMREPRFKKCRRLNLNVCGHPKAMKRAEKAGQARDRKKLSEYGIQLLEKQRLRGYYEVMEKQFYRYFLRAMKDEQITGTALVRMLETRLDNLVYRSGYATSIRQARQMVGHGHILVNGKKINIPSYAVLPGDVIALTEKSQSVQLFKDNFLGTAVSYPYLSRDEENYATTLIRNPEREEIPIEIEDHLIVEYYSKFV